MTWFDVVLIGVLIGAVLIMLSWADILPRQWAVAVWLAAVSAAAVVSRMFDAPRRENTSDPKTEPYDTDLEAYDDDDEDLDTSDPGDDPASVWLDAHRRGAGDD